MRTTIASTALAVMFLSAGAFAGNNNRVVQPAGNLTGFNVTVIEKNQAYPVLGPILVEACKLEDCFEAA